MTIKAHEHLNENARNAVNRWYDDSLKMRLESQDAGWIIVVMQRLHENDLAGFLLNRGGWDELRLAAIAPVDERRWIVVGDAPVSAKYEVVENRAIDSVWFAMLAAAVIVGSA